ncbi:Winged helix DNA-binding domain-containing protein [Quadrisphaera granulorum]|uniref:Winged helix DNA-binding protein n=1 Tax=Quadrisphaera granulorum TaxID=317664 RepID=A0A315ZVM0_9ACTN|nr:winged helix DNA-binding domain-containing protein [Quadrisphaera granulorum]PWJ49302.1 winged helix DNA-binding protein [Quadrisphaera granulorum]SZE98219.1 Winged helix DNA-binding domain-containing protein [Quadrisphaera granulorum]
MPDATPRSVISPIADLTRDDVARLRLVSQRLVPHPVLGLPPGPVEAVANLLAVQAQDLPAAHVAVASRTPGRDAAAVRAALDDGRLVRTWPMRGTLHLLTAADAGWMTRLLGPRAMAAAAKRWLDVGLDDAAFDRALVVARELLADGPASRDELGAAWTGAGFEPGSSTTYRLLNGLATRGELVLGPVRGADQLVVLASTWLPEGSRREHEPDEMLFADLVARYVAGHGPASVADLVRWSYQTTGAVKKAVAVAAASGLVAAVTCEGRSLLGGPDLAGLVADLDSVRAATEGVLLTAAFDELVLGYADRTATLSPEEERLVVPGGNGMFKPVVVVDGRAVGTWARTGSKRDRLVVTPFAGTLPAAVEAACQEAFAALPAALPGR